MRRQRLYQGLFLAAFVMTLAAAVAWPWIRSADLFLRLDPLLVLLAGTTARAVGAALLLPALLVLAATLIGGRLFCGAVCPLGTTLDWLSPAAARGVRDVRRHRRLQSWKTVALIFSLMAAVAGVSLAWAVSPLSLATRLYGLVGYPLLAHLSAGGIDMLRPAADSLDLTALALAQVKTPRFATGLFLLGVLTALIALNHRASRFWCRYLCPTGALLALAGRRPLIRRHVTEDCTECGLCSRRCPMGAISRDRGWETRWSECVGCGTCRQVCPAGAVEFTTDNAGTAAPVNIGRRRAIVAGVAGAGVALVARGGLTAPYPGQAEGQVLPPGLIRPPAALPEADFLPRCVRCGLCMTVCPTNVLQPIWLAAGPMGLFSPALVYRRGFCDPRCHRCAAVCPTGAIRSLTAAERRWAKAGTAAIDRRRCLAWEHHKACMVCDEVCPYDAIDFKRQPGQSLPVPHVVESRCAGCGYCEHFCPVRNRAAIEVTPMGALRLESGGFRQAGRQQGLTLQLKGHGAASPAGPAPATGFEGYGTVSGGQGEGGLAPGFDDGLAPGFDDGSD